MANSCCVDLQEYPLCSWLICPTDSGHRATMMCTDNSVSVSIRMKPVSGTTVT